MGFARGLNPSYVLGVEEPVGRISARVIRRRNSGAIRLAIAACAALLRGGIWLRSQSPSLHSAALMRATCSGFRKPS